MKKLCIIDGPSVLVSCFYGQAPKEYARARNEEEKALYLKDLLQTSNGQYINGVYGMTKYLQKLFKKIDPSHLVITWDTTRDTFRRVIYPNYKGNRSETPIELSSQFKLMQDLISEMGIKQLMNDPNETDMNNLFESDDYIGSLVERFEDEISVSVISKDKDMLQLISNNTSVWLMTSKWLELAEKYEIERHALGGVFEYDVDVTENELGVSVSQIVDLKALIGDPADNIPGVRNVGITSAPNLLREYGCIEDLYDYIRHLNGTDKETKAELKELKEFWKNDLGITRSPINSLIKTSDKPDEIVGEKSATISKELSTIKRNIPIPYTLNDLKVNINEEKMIKRMKELEFYSLMDSSKEDSLPEDAIQEKLLF